MDNDSLPVNSTNEQLKFFRSPIHHGHDTGTPLNGDNSRTSSDVSSTLPPPSGVTRPQNSRAIERIGYKYNPEDTPWLRRNDDATNLEVFYDLFFAASLNLFNRNQQMDGVQGLSSYIGFFSLMWTTWFVTSAFDVRFLTDSIFERLCRLAHLAVLVGFIVVSPNFDIAGENWGVFRAFAFTLMSSRITLGLEYAAVFVQAWHYKAKWQLAWESGLNFFNAILYAALQTRFGDENNRLFVSLYALCAVEIVSTIMLAIFYPILSFQGTPIIKRLSLLTLIIFGEGITIACTNVTEIIDASGPMSWTSQLWGTIAACIVTVYLAFMLYFDSLHNFYLSIWRTHVWTILHFPLHLVLTLFTEGCAQFIVIWRSIELEVSTINSWEPVLNDAILADSDSKFNVPIVRWIDDFFDAQPQLYYTFRIGMNDTLNDLGEFSGPARDELREALKIDLRNGNNHTIPELTEVMMNRPVVVDLFQNVTSILYTCVNVVFAQYGLDYYEDQMEDRHISGTNNGTEEFTSLAFIQGTNRRVYFRFRVVFQYLFACGGAFLALLTILYCIGRTDKWTRWAKFRSGTNIFLALCVGCVAFLSQWEEKDPSKASYENGPPEFPLSRYLATPWVLPPFAILFFLLLVLHHLPEEYMTGARFRKSARWVDDKLYISRAARWVDSWLHISTAARWIDSKLRITVAAKWIGSKIRGGKNWTKSKSHAAGSGIKNKMPTLPGWLRPKTDDTSREKGPVGAMGESDHLRREDSDLSTDPRFEGDLEQGRGVDVAGEGLRTSMARPSEPIDRV